MATPRAPARTLPFALVALLVLPILPAIVAQGDDADPYRTTDDWADIRGVAVGDHWTFEVSGNAEGTVHNEVKSVGNFTGHYRTSWPVFRVDSFTRLETEQSPSSQANDIKVPVTLEVDAQKWVRIDDYAVVEVRANVTVEDARPTESIIAYDPPLIEDVFPYSYDFRWKADVERYRKQGGEEPQAAKFTSIGTVEGREIVEVPAGKFLAWRVRHDISDDQYMIRWYSEAACDLVKEEVYKETTDELASRIELTDHSCSHTPKASPRYETSEVRLLAGKPRQVDPETGQPTEGPNIAPPTQKKDSPAVGFVAILFLVGAAAATWRRRDP